MATSFWESVGAPAVQAGLGMFGAKEDEKTAQERLRQAQGPLYDQTMGQAGKSLSLAGSMDPAQMAKQRFEQQQALLAPGYEQQQQALLRRLQATGQGGAATHGAVAGTQATPGVAMNPQMAAFLAAQAGEKAKSAYGSLDEGERYLDRLVNRSGMLQGQAQQARSTGLQALPPSRKSTGSSISGMLSGLLGNKDVLGMFGKGFGSIFGGGAGGVADAEDAYLGGAMRAMPRYEAPRFEMPQIGMDDLWGGDLNYGGMFDNWNI